MVCDMSNFLYVVALNIFIKFLLLNTADLFYHTEATNLKMRFPKLSCNCLDSEPNFMEGGYRM